MPNIHHELTIGATAETVYEAITMRSGLAGWWTPGASAEEEANTIARFPFGDDYFKEMRVIELKPFELIRWNCIAGTDEWVGTTISFKIEAGDKASLLKSNPEISDQLRQQGNAENVTVLIFKHENWKDHTPMYAECNYTWGRFLRSLKLFCEIGYGTPWPHQHSTQL
jgi:uncharacterized protein YndB with AHSA1/START domain